MAQRPPTPPPRRAPPPHRGTAERTSAGCLGVFLLPWLVLSLFAAFITAGAPLFAGVAGVISGGVSMLLWIPVIGVLGSVTWSALRTATGDDKRVSLWSGGGMGLAASVVVIFALSTLMLVAKTVGAALAGGTFAMSSALAALTGLVVMAAAGVMITAQVKKQQTRVRKRKRHDSRPRPPWSNPLARVEPANMLTEAVTNQYNLIAVFAAVAMSLILWNPLPAFLMGGLELFYLALLPDTKWFKRAVDSKYLEIAEEMAKERREEQLEFLTGEQKALHQRMLAEATTARDALEASNYPFDTSKIDRVIDHHLWLMELENYYGDIDDVTRLEQIEAELTRTEASLSGTSGRMADALKQRVDVLERRRQHFTKLSDHIHEIRSQRESLEDTLRLLSESALSAGPTSSDEIDDVLTHLEITEEVVLDFHSEEQELEAAIEQAVEEAGVAA